VGTPEYQNDHWPAAATVGPRSAEDPTYDQPLLENGGSVGGPESGEVVYGSVDGSGGGDPESVSAYDNLEANSPVYAQVDPVAKARAKARAEAARAAGERSLGPSMMLPTVKAASISAPASAGAAVVAGTASGAGRQQAGRDIIVDTSRLSTAAQQEQAVRAATLAAAALEIARSRSRGGGGGGGGGGAAHESSMQPYWLLTGLERGALKHRATEMQTVGTVGEFFIRDGVKVKQEDASGFGLTIKFQNGALRNFLIV
jgi:hypothetical protein